MGLASKLQAQQVAMAAQAVAGVLGGFPAGSTAVSPSAPPYPPAAGGSPYGMMPQGGGASAPYPPAAQQQMGAFPYPSPAGYAPAPAAGASPYPQPNNAARPQQPAPYPQQQQQMMMPGGGVAGPYGPAAAAPGQMQMPAPQMQQQQPQFAPQTQSAAPFAAAPSGGGVSSASGMLGSIQAKLSQTVATNQLQRFFTPQAVASLASRLDSRVNFRELAARWNMPVELSLDLAALALYDVVIVADDSGSMAFEENGERIDDLKMIAQKVSEVATLFDDDGILVRFMNSPVEGNSIRSPADVACLLSQVQYSGLTPLATSLQSKVLEPIVFSLAASGQLAKPVLIITITDGEPTDNPKDLVVQVVKDAQQRLAAQYGPKAVAFEFCQVGKDQRAQAFLAQLDAHPQVGGSIDVTSYFELESVEYQRRGINLSPSMWLVKMMVGAIDLSHDKGDEH